MQQLQNNPMLWSDDDFGAFADVIYDSMFDGTPAFDPSTGAGRKYEDPIEAWETWTVTARDLTENKKRLVLTLKKGEHTLMFAAAFDEEQKDWVYRLDAIGEDDE